VEFCEATRVSVHGESFLVAHFLEPAQARPDLVKRAWEQVDQLLHVFVRSLCVHEFVSGLAVRFPLVGGGVDVFLIREVRHGCLGSVEVRDRVSEALRVRCARPVISELQKAVDGPLVGGDVFFF
jgi:hypothetical protein